MSEPITVTVTSLSPDTVKVNGASSQTVQILNGGAVNVAVGTVSPGNATIVSGTLTINSVTTLAAGSQAYVKNDTGTAYAAKLDIGIPAGPATNVSVGNTTTLAAGSNATVTGTTDGANLTLAFGIPRGANGVTPSISIGNVTTGAAGSSASVTATTTNSGANVTLDLTIPRGDPGTNGSNGTSLTLSDATPSALGVAAAGTSNTVSRADHTHQLPVISYANLSGVPTNFPSNTTLVSGLSAGYSAINHAHNYVTALNNLTGALTLAAGPNVTLAANGSTLTIDSAAGLDANTVLDGGNYVGEILGGISFSVQPQSQTVSVTSSLSFGNSYTPTHPSAPSSTREYFGVSAYGNQVIQRVRVFESSSNAAAWYASSDNGATFSSVLSLVAMANTPFTPTVDPQFASNGSRLVFTSGFAGTVQSGSSGSAGMLRYIADGDAFSTAAIASQFPDAVGVAYLASAGRFAAITANEIYTSPDGVSWTLRFNHANVSENQFVFAVGSRFLVLPFSTVGGVGYGGTGTGGQTTQPRLMHSADGISWTTVVRSYGYSSVAYSGTRLVACRGGFSSVDWSTDGLAWTTVTLPVACTRVAWAAGLFWAFPGAATTDVLTSPDGVTWTLRDLPSSAIIQGAASSDGSNVAFLPSTVAGAGYQATRSSTTASANLTVSASATSGNPVAYQWQSSLDAGSTWSNVANATSSALNLTGLTQLDSGTRYRAAASATGAATVNSQSATLTVTG